MATALMLALQLYVHRFDELKPANYKLSPGKLCDVGGRKGVGEREVINSIQCSRSQSIIQPSACDFGGGMGKVCYLIEHILDCMAV